MSEKTIGSIGQKYEDRKTKKEGTLYLRDEENKRLQMLDNDGNKFYVSYASFKSSWRKTAEKTEDVKTVEKPKKQKKEKEEDSQIYRNDLSGLNIKFDDKDKVTKVYDNDILVAKVTDEGKKCVVEAIPDVYVRADWGDYIVKDSVKFTRHCPVTTSLKFVSSLPLEETLEFIKASVKYTNTSLYKNKKETA